MKSPLQGIISLIVILGGIAFAVQWVAQAQNKRLDQLDQYQSKLHSMDVSIARLDKRIAKESESLHEVEPFYHAWIPEIQKCTDADSLISAMLVDAYALNLVPMKKAVKREDAVEFRGRMGTSDRINVAVAGRYDRLVRFLDRIRRNYPFLNLQRVRLSVNDANVVMSLELSSCRLKIPQEDLKIIERSAARKKAVRQWTHNDEERNNPE